MESILTSIKKVLGIESDVTHFDPDIILHINTALMVIDQLGIGSGLIVTDDSTEWSDLLGTSTNLEAVKSYMFLKVKMLFDPPTIASVIEAYQRQIAEYEYRLCMQAEGGS